MTSSLVGSEMCIRDSVTRHRSTGRLWNQPAFGERVAVTRPGPKKASEPVSYTHLTLPTICSV
eukprot:11401915-Prorocentrum_lima.AAC.1